MNTFFPMHFFLYFGSLLCEDATCALSPIMSNHDPLLSLEIHQVQRMVRMLRSDARLARRYAEAPSCPNGDTLRDGHPAALKVRGNTQGLGNRVGWYLTVAAIAETLGRPCVYTTWPNLVRKGHLQAGNRDYDFDLVDEVIAWPRALRFINDTDASERWLRVAKAGATLRLDDNSSVLQADLIPFHPRPYVNDYVPECAWQMIVNWQQRRLTNLPISCMSREAFLASYRRVQRELRPKVPLCYPRAKTYVVLHIRRGDKEAWAKRAKRSELGEALRNATALDQVIKGALLPVINATGLPVLLLTDGGQLYKEYAEQTLVAAGVQIARPRKTMGRECGPLSPDLTHAERGAKTNASATLATHPKLPGGRHRAALTDFFAIVDAAAVVVIAPKGVGPGQGLQESSFASVSALTGTTPHLTPVPFALGGKMAAYQRLGNEGGAPLRGIFFLDDLETFIDRVRHELDHSWTNTVD